MYHNFFQTPPFDGCNYDLREERTSWRADQTARSFKQIMTERAIGRKRGLHLSFRKKGMK